MENLDSYGIKGAKVKYQLSSNDLVQETVKKGFGQIVSSGALKISTGEHTGRSPKDRFIVKDDITKDKVWWGDVNMPFDSDKFDKLYDRLTTYCEGKELYVRDAYLCTDKRYSTNTRVICELPWTCLFVYNMFLRLDESDLKDFTPEWTVLCVPSFKADPKRDGTKSENFAVLNFSKKTIIIGGTAYTGEVKKGMFSVLNFMLSTYKKTLPMHCSANVGKDHKTAIFFGLSGTGKTTLSADPNRKLIGDDEHGWTSEDTVFNFEGGCYAKVIDLTQEQEPDIYRAIKKGALLENVIVGENGKVDYTDASITQNTRVSYPIHHIENIIQPSIGKHPSNIFFLTADAFGVLPPISKLNPSQAAFYFISGYTAKIAGTEEGIDEPLPSFSACFGAPFMPLHPTVYANMLSEKMKLSGTNVWLLNTGWSGGVYNVGSRIKLKYTRAMITAALNDSLLNVDYEIHPIFQVSVPKTCPEIPQDILNPEKVWKKENSQDYATKAKSLAMAFAKNFEKFSSGASEEVRQAAPLVK